MMTASTETHLRSRNDPARLETSSGSPVGVQMTSAEVALISGEQNGDSNAFVDLVRPYERARWLRCSNG